MTERQKQVLDLYEKGYKQYEIANILGVHKSTISRTMRRAIRVKCPFSSNCLECWLEDCAIKDEYAYMLNNENIDFRKVRKEE